MFLGLIIVLIIKNINCEHRISYFTILLTLLIYFCISVDAYKIVDKTGNDLLLSSMLPDTNYGSATTFIVDTLSFSKYKG